MLEIRLPRELEEFRSALPDNVTKGTCEKLVRILAWWRGGRDGPGLERARRRVMSLVAVGVVLLPHAVRVVALGGHVIAGTCSTGF